MKREANGQHSGKLSTPWHIVGFIGGGLGVANDILYLWLLSNQHGSSLANSRVVVVSAAAALFAALAIWAVAARLPATQSSVLLYGAGAGLLGLGAIAIFSIGVPWLIAGSACLCVALRLRRELASLVTPAVVLLGLAAGLYLTRP